MKRATVERRKQTRDLYTLDVLITVVPALGSVEPYAHSVSGRTINLSETGICVATDEPLDSAAFALCKISLPFSGTNVPTLMEVRWTQKGVREKSGYYFAGLQFLL
jgi:hypothetical protein